MTWQTDPTHTAVEFSAKHMLITTVKGRFADVDIEADINPDDLAASNAVVRIKTASIDTHDAQRDGHLRSPDFFDAEGHPEIVFATRRLERKANGEVRIAGDLTIRDTTREVVFDGELHGPTQNPWGQRVIALSAEAKVNRKDWGLNWNAALETGGFLVSDTVKLSIDAELVEAA